LRYNEWPERAHAKHEEKSAIFAEQQSFGGNEGDKAAASSYDFLKGDSMFIVEQFRPTGGAAPTLQMPASLFTPGSFQKTHGGRDMGSCVAVLDLNGHFTIGLRQPVEDGARASLLMLNTTTSDYLRMAPGSATMAAFALDFLHAS
jgi:hypothetical protein